MSELIQPATEMRLGLSSEISESFLDGRLTLNSRSGLIAEERAILSHLPQGQAGHGLVINPRYGVSAAALALLNPEMQVHAFFDDAWFERKARNATDPLGLANLTLETAADPPDRKYDVVVLPFDMQGITDLLRERVRLAANQWLKKNGLLIASTDNLRDKFVNEEVKRSFGGAHRSVCAGSRPGVAYVVRKKSEPKVNPPHSYSHLEVRQGETGLSFTSRLGVFCHDKLDDGTRALIAAAEVEGSTRILDLGCGCGVVGLIAGIKAPVSHVVFLDSNARAIESTRKNVEAFGMEDRVQIILSAEPTEGLKDLEPFDCVLTNPPYYGKGRIALEFWKAATEKTKPGGHLWLVTKDSEWHRLQYPEGAWSESEGCRIGGYDILHFERMAAPPG